MPYSLPCGLAMVWFGVTGFGVALLLTGTTLMLSVSLGNVARHLRPRSSISTSSEKILGRASLLSWIGSSTPLVLFGCPLERVVVVVVLVVAAVVVGTVLLPVVALLPG